MLCQYGLQQNVLIKSSLTNKAGKYVIFIELSCLNEILVLFRDFVCPHCIFFLQYLTMNQRTKARVKLENTNMKHNALGN